MSTERQKPEFSPEWQSWLDQTSANNKRLIEIEDMKERMAGDAVQRAAEVAEARARIEAIREGGKAEAAKREDEQKARRAKFEAERDSKRAAELRLESEERLLKGIAKLIAEQAAKKKVVNVIRDEEGRMIRAEVE